MLKVGVLNMVIYMSRKVISDLLHFRDWSCISEIGRLYETRKVCDERTIAEVCHLARLGLCFRRAFPGPHTATAEAVPF